MANKIIIKSNEMLNNINHKFNNLLNFKPKIFVVRFSVIKSCLPQAMKVALLGLLFSFVIGCKKEWLEAKRDIKLVVPSTLEDIRLLLHDDDNLAKDYVSMAELSADEYYIPSNVFPSVDFIDRNASQWKSDIYEGIPKIKDWDQAYYQILVANVSLDALKKIERTDENATKWDVLKGSALFIRAKALYYLNQQFGNTYNPATSSNDLGVSIKLTPETDEKIVRASVEENYTQMLNDMTTAVELLPDEGEFTTDPTKAAAHGYLARIYLIMGNYQEAYNHANECLIVNSALMDFNTLDLSGFFLIPPNNPEIVHNTWIGEVYFTFYLVFGRTPSKIYDLYDDNDLRKSIYFYNLGSGEDGTYGFRASYSGGVDLFSGIATDEMYLIRAECSARLGNVVEAMDGLNDLLITRWKTGTFVAFTASDTQEAISIILLERRKELLRRGLRWSDLRRLNLDPEYQQTITRTSNGDILSLAPNDPRYVLPIPEYIIKYNGIQQNQR